jgi:hypothetical protein
LCQHLAYCEVLQRSIFALLHFHMRCWRAWRA